jgi:hypothetical protein
MDKHGKKGELLFEILSIKNEVNLFKLQAQAESNTGSYYLQM